MLFSSISFLYVFLPMVLAVYYLAPAKLKNLVLLGASLFFYFYGEPVYSILIVLSSAAAYVHGLWIKRSTSRKTVRLALISSIISGISFLVVFKYADFIIENLNMISGLDLPLPGLRLPIGISFYTFQVLSYTIDVYRGQASVQNSLVKLTTYTALFPQLIAGPIIRYNTIESQLSKRCHSWSDLAIGINRFVVGLAKKVVIANTLGDFAEQMSKMQQRPVLYYWLAGISIMLQIYFDFSAYSDMAIGLGHMFGFKFQENFNYPFIAKSITEFWRRWHISLGTWFRDYVYIPMGGNRVSKIKWVRNIAVVWALTGLWHGAEWNFVIWGLYFSFILVLEKAFVLKLLDILPSMIRRFYTLLTVMISFVIFKADGMPVVLENLGGMFGLLDVPFMNAEISFHLQNYAFILVIGMIGSTPLIRSFAVRLTSAARNTTSFSILQPVMHLSLLLVCTAFLVDGSFNPFLYFRF